MSTGEVTIAGRVLFLTEDPALLRCQLDGADLAWSTAAALRSDISTDEILPVHHMYEFDERLGGCRPGNQQPEHTGDEPPDGPSSPRTEPAQHATLPLRARRIRNGAPGQGPIIAPTSLATF